MFEPEIEYTYGQVEPPVPYEPYKGYTTNPSRSRQQTFAAQSTMPAPRVDVARTTPARPAMQVRSEQKKPATPRMSKAEALEVVDQCKRWLVAGTMVAFGVISGLVAGHVIGSANQSNNQSAPSINTPSNSPSINSPSNNGGFFQQGGNNFGNGNSGQSPFSGSHTS